MHRPPQTPPDTINNSMCTTGIHPLAQVSQNLSVTLFMILEMHSARVRFASRHCEIDIICQVPSARSGTPFLLPEHVLVVTGPAFPT